VNVAGTKLGRQTIDILVEQLPRVIAGRFKMPVVSALFLLALDRDRSYSG
jgi:hypothetical protein